MAEFEEVVAEFCGWLSSSRDKPRALQRAGINDVLRSLHEAAGEIQIAALHRGAVKASNSENIGCCARRPKEGLLGNLKEEAWA